LGLQRFESGFQGCLAFLELGMNALGVGRAAAQALLLAASLGFHEVFVIALFLPVHAADKVLALPPHLGALLPQVHGINGLSGGLVWQCGVEHVTVDFMFSINAR
jgi:hypothetical protein